MPAILHLAASTIRGKETSGKSCGKPLIKRCTEAAEGAAEPTRSTLLELAGSLAEILEEESAQIDPLRGNEKKIQGQRGTRDVSDLAGKWSAIWQTSRNRSEAVVLESVELTPTKSGKVQFGVRNLHDASSWLELEGYGQDETPGHFLWEAACRMSPDLWVAGDFHSQREGPRVNGQIRLKLGNFRDTMVGAWMGISADSEQTYGLLVMGRDERLATERFTLEREKSPALPIIPAPQ